MLSSNPVQAHQHHLLPGYRITKYSLAKYTIYTNVAGFHLAIRFHFIVFLLKMNVITKLLVLVSAYVLVCILAFIILKIPKKPSFESKLAK